MYYCVCKLIGGWAESHGRDIKQTQEMIDKIQSNLSHWCQQQKIVTEVIYKLYSD